MTSRERVELTLKHEESDRVPIGEIEINSKQASEVLGREAFIGVGGKYFVKRKADMLISGEIEEYARKTGVDAVELCSELGIDFYRVWPNQYRDSVIPEVVSENTWRYTDEQLDYWEEIHYDPELNTWSLVDDSITARGGMNELENYVKRLEDAADLSIGLAFYMMPVSKAIDDREFIAINTALSHKKGKELFIVGNARFPFPGYERWLPVYLEAMIVRPDLVRRYCDVLIEVWVQYVEKQLELGVCGIVDGMDFAYHQSIMMSPECFRQFLLPYWKRLSAKCHEYNKPFIKHADGNIMPIEKEFMIDSGIDGYHAIEPVAGMDIFYLKKEYGERITLLGNVDCTDILVNGPKEKIEENVKELMKDCKKNGGYILSSSNSIHDGVSLKNYLVMIEAGKKYGVY
jgi:hypothetical protein